MNMHIIPDRLLSSFLSGYERRREFNTCMSMLVIFVIFLSPLIDLISKIPHFCFFEEFLGIPCPGCGITTSLLCLARGDVWGSIKANPCGIMMVTLLFVNFTISAGKLLKWIAFDRYMIVISSSEKIFLFALMLNWVGNFAIGFYH